MRISVMLAAALAACAGTAAAQQAVNQAIPTGATGAVEIVNVAGEVRVVGWDRNEIRVTGTLGQGTERLAVETRGNRTSIRVIVPRGTNRNVRGSELEIRIPDRKDVQVRTTSAEIAVSGVEGSVAAHSVSGRVELSGGSSQTAAHTTSGEVVIRGAHQRLNASSTSGGIHLEGSVRENAAVETVSGEVVVRGEMPDLSAKTVSGRAIVEGPVRRISLGTVSGEATITSPSVQYLAFESVSGSLRFNGGLQPRAAVNIQSHSGDVRLALPANLGARFDVSTFSGGISSDFGPAAQRGSRRGPGEELRFSSGEGGALVTVKTFSGSVALQRR